MIIGFFKHYKDNQKDFKGVTGFIKQVINTIAKKAGHKESFLSALIVSYLTSQRLTLG